jgi:hypothetical protein
LRPFMRIERLRTTDFTTHAPCAARPPDKHNYAAAVDRRHRGLFASV